MNGTNAAVDFGERTHPLVAAPVATGCSNLAGEPSADRGERSFLQRPAARCGRDYDDVGSLARVPFQELRFFQLRPPAALADGKLHAREHRQALARVAGDAGLVLPLQAEAEQPVGEVLPVRVVEILPQDGPRLFVIHRPQFGEWPAIDAAVHAFVGAGVDTPQARPHGVIIGPDGAAWVTDGGQNAIVRVDADTEAVKVFPLPSDQGYTNLNTAAFDSDGILWFTGQSGIYGRLNPATGEMQVFEAPRGRGPYGITSTPDGEVFYASLAGSHIATIDKTTNLATIIEPPTQGQGARRVWSDSLGRIWVSEIVKAFEQHAYALFRLNPRGPLKNRTNQRIYKTLIDPNRRDMFFLFNNGLTALCDSWSIDQGSEMIHIRNLQIVNGCQTTVTIAKARSIVMANKSIVIGLRLIEGPGHMNTEIAESTNTQTRLTAEDFKANDKLQRDLKQQFASLPEPWFYEIKRGDWDIASRDRASVARFAASGTYRRVKMRDLAQATLAMLGEPGKAKDQIRVVFEQPDMYRKVFPESIRAQQLLLPLTLYREADALCRNWGPPYAAYARYTLVALAGQKIAADGRLPGLADSANWLARDEDRAELLQEAKAAVANFIAVLGKDFPGPREFFRSEDRYRGLVEAFQSLAG